MALLRLAREMEEWSHSLRSANEPKRWNPWIHMWLHPRMTIQQVVDTGPTRWVIFLAMIAGISDSLDRASFRCTGDEVPLAIIFLMALFFGPIGGLIQLYLFGGLTYWVGRRMGGKAFGEDIRAAMAWSSIPVIYGLAIWILKVAIFGKEIFTTETPTLDADPFLGYQLVALELVHIALGIWSFVIFLHALGQVQGFSVWKALANVVLATLVILVPLALLGGLFYWGR